MYCFKSYQVARLVVFAAVVFLLVAPAHLQAADNTSTVQANLVDLPLSIANDFIVQAAATGAGMVDRLTKAVGKVSEVQIFTGRPAAFGNPIHLKAQMTIGPYFDYRAVGMRLKITF